MSIYDMLLSNAMGESGGGGGGGSSDLTVTIQTLNIPQTTLTGEESDGRYYASAEVGTMCSEIVDGIPYDEEYNYYTIFSDTFDTDIGNVYVMIDRDYDTGKFVLRANGSDPFTITYPATTATFFRATKEVADTFGNAAVIYGSW